MIKILKKYNIELTQDELNKFEDFLKIFKKTNSQINLSAIREDNAIIEKHFIDSIMLNVFLELKGEVADLGTGGGFPGIPLAIVNSKSNFTLIDSVGKKLKAIDYFIKKLKLNNIKTLNGRAEDIGQNIQYREKFDFVVSRATANLPILLEYCLPLIKIGGIFIAYKLDDKGELKSSKKALIRLGGKIIKVKNYKLANQKRVFIFIKKINKTHKKYPRKTGEPIKNPIK